MARKKQFLGLDKRKKSHITRSGKYDRCGKMVFFFLTLQQLLCNLRYIQWSIIIKKSNMPNSLYRTSCMIIFLEVLKYNIAVTPTCNTFALRRCNLYCYTIIINYVSSWRHLLLDIVFKLRLGENLKKLFLCRLVKELIEWFIFVSNSLN